MSHETIRQKKKKPAWLYIVPFLFFYVHRDILVFGLIKDSALPTIALFLPLPLVIFMAVYCIVKKKRISLERMQVFSILASFFLLTMIMNGDVGAGYFFMLLAYIECILLLTFFSAEEINHFFYNSMIVICVFSLTIFLVQALFPELLEKLPVITNIADYDFYFAILTNTPTFHYGFIRCWGPFREPGVFQAFIIIALLYGLLRDQKGNIVKVGVLLITLLATMSTTGYIALFFVLAALFFEKRTTMSRERRRMVFFLVAGGIVTFVFALLFTDIIPLLISSVFSKLFGGELAASMDSRVASFLSCFYMMLQSPLWGEGLRYVYDNFTPISQEVFGITAIDNTNTLLTQGARFGVFFLLFYMWRYYKGLKAIYGGTTLSNLCIFAAYMCLLFGQGFPYSAVIALPMFYISSDRSEE